MMGDEHRATDTFVHTEMCDRNHKAIDTKLLAMNNLLTNIDNRLYHDNGNKSIQSIINGHSQILKFVLWVMAIIGTCSITTSLTILWQMVRKHIEANGV